MYINIIEENTKDLPVMGKKSTRRSPNGVTEICFWNREAL